MGGGGGGPAEPVLQLNPSKILAFTMAEILLSLTIIGVVAAITLPSLTGNINERTWNTQRKALYARFSQAIALMPSLNGYGTLTEDESGSIEDTAAETFITSGLSKVLKINNICDNDHLEDCGIPSKMTDVLGSQINVPKKISELNSLNTNMSWSTEAFIGSYSFIDSKAAAFETQNGESILAYYNPNCQGNMQESDYYYIAPKICANFIYDLNGNKGPNTVGKDIGIMSVLYPSDSVVAAPVPYLRNAGVQVNFHEAAEKCTEMDPEYRAPNLGELASMFYNMKLIRLSSGAHHWSTTRYDSNTAWVVSTATGRAIKSGIRASQSYNLVRCVKR